MTMDEYLEDVRRAHGDTDTDVWLVAQVTRLLAIIEAQRAELGKAERVVGRLVSSDTFSIVEAGGLAAVAEHFGGNAAIAKRFEEGEL